MTDRPITQHKRTHSHGVQRSRIKAVALPSSHGGWGFLLEPVLLGLLVAPSTAGALISTTALGAFLAYQPLKIALKDRLARRRTARTPTAELFAVLYGTIAAVSLVGALWTSGYAFWLPLAMAAPLVLTQYAFDTSGRSRELLPELLGALALGMIAPAVALAGGWDLGAAMTLWGLLAARTIPSILYVRARLRLERGETYPAVTLWAAHAAALMTSMVLAYLAYAPWLGVLAVGLLGMRAGFGLSHFRRPTRAQTVGFQEIGYGLLTVIIFAAGYLFTG